MYYLSLSRFLPARLKRFSEAGGDSASERDSWEAEFRIQHVRMSDFICASR
jgi:hypothetical protein